MIRLFLLIAISLSFASCDSSQNINQRQTSKSKANVDQVAAATTGLEPYCRFKSSLPLRYGDQNYPIETEYLLTNSVTNGGSKTYYGKPYGKPTIKDIESVAVSSHKSSLNCTDEVFSAAGVTEGMVFLNDIKLYRDKAKTELVCNIKAGTMMDGNLGRSDDGTVSILGADQVGTCKGLSFYKSFYPDGYPDIASLWKRKGFEKDYDLDRSGGNADDPASVLKRLTELYPDGCQAKVIDKGSPFYGKTYLYHTSFGKYRVYVDDDSDVRSEITFAKSDLELDCDHIVPFYEVGLMRDVAIFADEAMTKEICTVKRGEKFTYGRYSHSTKGKGQEIDFETPPCENVTAGELVYINEDQPWFAYDLK